MIVSYVHFLLSIAPPGTSDEHISVVNFLRDVGIDGGILVTTPQEVALADVRKEIRFCQHAGVKIVGIIENMSNVQVQKIVNELQYSSLPAIYTILIISVMI